MLVDEAENRERYCAYFERIRTTYLANMAIYTVLSLAEVGFLVFKKGKLDAPVVTIAAIAALVIFIIQLIAYTFRYFDIVNLISHGFPYKYADITVKKLKSKDINGTYCTIYLDYIGKKIEIGKKYKICYITNCFGHYAVSADEIDKEYVEED